MRSWIALFEDCGTPDSSQSPDAPNEFTPREDLSRLSQFSLAAIFYVTTLACLIFSALAPFLRAINTENRLAVLLYGGFQIIVVVAFLGGYAASRLRAVLMTDKGELVHRTTFMEQGPIGIWRSVRALWTTVPAMLILLVAGTWITTDPRSIAVFINPYMLAVQVFAINEAVRASLSLYYGVDKQDLEVFQSGYIHGGYSFRPWKEVKSIRPAEYDDCSLMVVCEKVGSADEQLVLFTKKLSVRPHTRNEVCNVILDLLSKQH